jgi:hypothetical protein
MSYREIIAVCSQNHTKHRITLCGQNVGCLYVKPGPTKMKPFEIFYVPTGSDMSYSFHYNSTFYFPYICTFVPFLCLPPTALSRFSVSHPLHSAVSLSPTHCTQPFLSLPPTALSRFSLSHPLHSAVSLSPTHCTQPFLSLPPTALSHTVYINQRSINLKLKHDLKVTNFPMRVAC